MPPTPFECVAQWRTLSEAILAAIQEWRLQHPKATDALIASFEKVIGKTNTNTYWYYHLIPDLPKDAVPKLEALIPRVKDREQDRFVGVIQELRDK